MLRSNLQKKIINFERRFQMSYESSVFLGRSGFLYKICSQKIIVLVGELHIILNLTNLEIGEHSSFFNVLKINIFKMTLKIRFFIDINWSSLIV